jgi:hypothetical protein
MVCMDQIPCQEHLVVLRLINVLTLLLSDPEGSANTLLIPYPIFYPGEAVSLLTDSELQSCCGLLREIFGDRGQLSTVPLWEIKWRTESAVAIATYMYETQDFSPMPIMADALQDAGCDTPEIIKHCRNPGVHTRGCWVVDFVLGKA